MALKLTISNIVEVPGPLREHYASGSDGKFHLSLAGDHPDTVKLSEFREKNVALLKEQAALKAQYEGVDLEAAKTALAKVPELTAKLATFDGVDPAEYRSLKQRPDTSAELAAEKAAHAATQLKNLVTLEFLKVGGRESAVDYMLGNAAKTFTFENGALTTTEFSPTKPGEKLTIAEWLGQQVVVSDFAFKPSSGGGAHSNPTRVRLGAASNAKELRNPTPQQLGRHASDIASGKLRVVYE